MRRWILGIIPLLVVLASVSRSVALPPDDTRALREGANHRLGDDSFVAAFGRAPDAGDSESLRMRTHLIYVHEYLSARAATRPELAPVRARLLGYLADYIDAGITPKNTRLPWRSPVFIDDDGNICAVGYLIERSVGRALAEQITATHRHAFLEDIAAAMPAVHDWIEASGLSLDELASIQPGYEGAELPWVEQWRSWTAAAWQEDRVVKKNGRYDQEESGRDVRGRFHNHHMQGRWTKKTKEGVLVGKGTFVAGAGTWRSLYPNGKRMAEGPYLNDRPNGTWRLYHPSGNLAAIGKLSEGQRHGEWTFFYDTTSRTPISKGRFVRGSYAAGRFVGEWRHFNADGSLLAVSRPRGKETFELTFSRTADGVRHEVRRVSDARLEMFARGSERIYRRDEKLYDADGNQLTQDGDEWTASTCKWSEEMRRAARRGNLTRLTSLMPYEYDEALQCYSDKPVTVDRGRVLDAMLDRKKSPTPAFIKQLLEIGPAHYAEMTEDMHEMLAANIVQWPHINVRFMDLFVSLPGYEHPMLCPGDCRY